MLLGREGLFITAGALPLRACLFLACRPLVAIFDIVLVLVKVFSS